MGAGVGLALLAGCPRSAAGPGGAARFEPVRGLFELYCGQCHRPDSPDALPGALAVYDLSEPDPLRGLSDAQLAEAHRRFDEQRPPDDELSALRAYFRAELAARDTDPRGFPPTQRDRPAADPVVTPPTGCRGEACFARLGGAFTSPRQTDQ